MHLAWYSALRAHLRRSCGDEYEWSRYSDTRILCCRRRGHKGVHRSLFGVEW